LTRKQARFELTEKAKEAFNTLKQALMDATSLAFPYPDRPCVLDTDASDVGVSQRINENERPLHFSPEFSVLPSEIIALPEGNFLL